MSPTKRKRKVVKLKSLRNIYSTRMVVRNAPSGKVYNFDKGEVQTVDPLDVDFLLGLERKQGGRSCCGGANAANQKYFTEV